MSHDEKKKEESHNFQVNVWIKDSMSQYKYKKVDLGYELAQGTQEPDMLDTLCHPKYYKY